MRPHAIAFRAVALSLSLAASACGAASGRAIPEIGVRATPEQVAFPEILLGGLAQRTVAFENYGADAVTVDLAIAGESSSAFALGDERHLRLALGQAAEVVVTYRPGSVGKHVAELRYAARGASATVALKGAAVLADPQPSPSIEVSPEQVLVPAGTASDWVTVVVQVQNAGDAWLQFGSQGPKGWTPQDPELVTDRPEAFRLHTQGLLTEGLAPGATMALSVVAATAPGVRRNATLRIYSNDPDRPRVEVPIGTEPVGCLEASTDLLAFGTVGLWCQSEPLNLTLTNLCPTTATHIGFLISNFARRDWEFWSHGGA